MERPQALIEQLNHLWRRCKKHGFKGALKHFLARLS